MALSEEFTAGLTEATEAAVVEAEADVVDPVDPVDAVDGGGDGEEVEGKGGDTEVVADDAGEDEPNEPDGEEAIKEGEEVDNGDDPPPARSESLVERAILTGMSMQDALAFPSDQSLANTCNLLEQSQLAAEGEEAAEEVEPDLLEALENLDPEKYDEGDIETIGTLVRAIRQQQTQIKELQAGVDQTAQAGQAAAGREVEIWFNGEVAALGPDFKDVLGEGEHSSLVPGSPQHDKREAIAEQVSVILAGCQATGKAIPPREEVFQQAAGLVLRDEMKEIHERKLTSALRKRGKQHISRAGRREKGQSTETPVDATVAALKRKFYGGE